MTVGVSAGWCALQCMFYCLFHLYLNILGEVSEKAFISRVGGASGAAPCRRDLSALKLEQCVSRGLHMWWGGGNSHLLVLASLAAFVMHLGQVQSLTFYTCTTLLQRSPYVVFYLWRL